MGFKESDIKYENGDFWVFDTKDSYTVMRNGVTHATSQSSYKRDDDGLSIAIARCDYLAKHGPKFGEYHD